MTRSENPAPAVEPHGTGEKPAPSADAGTLFPPERRPGRTFYVLIAVLAAALVFRLWGIAFGMPYDLTYDEVHEMVRAFKLGAGEYDWRGFGKGGLYFILFVEYGFLYVTWLLSGVVESSKDFALHYFRDPTPFYLLGRVTVALMGTATCLAVYLIGRRLYGPRTGIAAAVIGAFAYFHAVWSHYINVDIGATLAVWCAVLAWLEYEKTGKSRWLSAAGALGGAAIAFKLPGAIAVVPLSLALVTAPGRLRNPRLLAREAVIVFFSLLAALTLIAPEWIPSLKSIPYYFSKTLGSGYGTQLQQPDLTSSISRFTMFFGHVGYPALLGRDYNLALSLAAAGGAIASVIRRDRWGVIFTVTFLFFVAVMTLADRPAAERYMLPVVPALWLLGARAIDFFSVKTRKAYVAAPAVIVAVPLFALVRHDYEFTRPDTRIVAKEWIERNVPPDSKILMDGMQYRFVQSPPLTPNRAAVDRRLRRAGEAERISRGISKRTLEIYAEAMSRLKGPAYDLHSTVFGLAVKDLDYYFENAFDYIVTSSLIADRYEREMDRKRFPESARFYDRLKTDPRVRPVYSVGPVPWRRRGPTIRIYKLDRSAASAARTQGESEGSR